MKYSNLDRDGLLSKIKELEHKLEISKGNKASETWQFYENIIEGVQDGIWITDENDIIFFSNAGMERIAGIPREEINGCNFFTDFPKETVGELLPYYNQARSDRKAIWYDIQVNTPAGRSTWQNGWLIPQFEEESYKGIICTVRDVTLRRQAELDLKESEGKYKNLVETASDAIYMMSEDGRIIDTNHSACVMLGKVKEEIIGSMIDSVDPNFPLDDFLNFWKKIAFNKQAIFETSHLRKDGSLIPIEISGKKFKQNGKVFYYGIARDITERKQAANILENEKRRFYMLLESFPGFIYLQAPDYSIKYFNKYFREHFGDPLNRPCYEVLHRSNKPCEECHTFKVFKTQEHEIWEWAHAPDNKNYLVYDYPFIDADGSELVLEIGLDITDLKLAEKALRESEKKFKSIFENKGTATGLFGDDGVILDCNYQFVEMSGFEKEEIIGKIKWSDFVLEEDLKRMQQYHAARTNKGNPPPSNYECGITNRRGEILNVIVNISLMGSVRIVSLTDISDRKKVEYELKESEIRHRTYIENAPLGIFVVNGEGKYIDVNQEACKLLGYTKDELLQLSIPDVAFAEAGVNNFKKLTEGGELNYESGLRRKDGSIVYVRLDAVAIGNDQFMGFCANIEERIQYQIELLKSKEKAEESEEKYRLLHENAGLGIGYYSPEGIVLSFNSTASKYMNGVPADFEGKSVFELYPKQDAELYFERLQKSKNSDEVLVYEDFIQLPTQEMWFLSTYTKIVNSKNEVLGIQIISQNISEQKQSELEIKKLNEELEKRVLDRTQQLETINKELEAFTYSVSHDLKAPLRAIIGFSQMLAEDYSGLLDSEGKRYINVIKNNANNMADLIRDLLDLSRTGRIQIRRKRVDLAPICKRITGELLDGLNDRDISFKIGSLKVVNADETLIYQLFLNLISNAVKFTSQNEKTEIEIGSSPQEERTVFYVKDNGIGFDMRYADKVFEVFQRLHDNEEFSGTGIGLSIVQRIIAKHEGKIWVESEKGKGTTFFFTLG